MFKMMEKDDSTKLIRVSKDVHAVLKSKKKIERETFNDVISRIILNGEKLNDN